ASGGTPMTAAAGCRRTWSGRPNATQGDGSLSGTDESPRSATAGTWTPAHPGTGRHPPTPGALEFHDGRYLDSFGCMCSEGTSALGVLPDFRLTGGAVFYRRAQGEGGRMGSLAGELKRGEAAARAEAGRLRARIEELSGDLGRAEERVLRLAITGEEVARVLEEPPGADTARREGTPAAGTLSCSC